MNEETQQPKTEEIETGAEEAATEPQAEESLPEPQSEPVIEPGPPGGESTFEDEFPSELDLTEGEPRTESESETIHITASDEAVMAQDTEQLAETTETTVETAAEAVIEPIGEPEAAEEQITATREELKPVIEALLFVADEPLPLKQLCKVLGDVSEEGALQALGELAAEYDARSSGLEVREIAGGWRLSTRPQNHEFIRKYLKSRPSARLSLPALETLAVIAYKQPITIPEILEIRGVSSSSAIKTLLEKRLIVTKGRKETVGKPMLYGTSKEFLIQFGLKDLGELPSIEDFEDLAQ